jgi:hypothetical protein
MQTHISEPQGRAIQMHSFLARWLAYHITGMVPENHIPRTKRELVPRVCLHSVQFHGTSLT